MRNIMAVLLVLFCAGELMAQQASVGDSVWAQWRPNAWYHGKVAKTCELGLFIQFDDGDKACVPTSLVARDRAPGKVKVGDRVLANWHGKQYPGVVTAKGYSIQFDDHDQRQGVPASEIRVLGKAPDRKDKPKVGSVVWVQWKPNAIYRGKVGRKCAYGLFVNFDDGDSGCFSPAVMAVDTPPKSLKTGARVLARWKGNRFFPGTVREMAGSGKVSVRFDDGDTSVVNLVDTRTVGF